MTDEQCVSGVARRLTPRSLSRLRRRHVEVSDDRTVRGLERYLLCDGIVGLTIAVTGIAFAWPGTERVSNWSDLGALGVAAILAVGASLLWGGPLSARLLGSPGRLRDRAARKLIGARGAAWIAGTVVSTAAGQDAVGVQLVLSVGGLVFASYALWLYPWRGRPSPYRTTDD